MSALAAEPPNERMKYKIDQNVEFLKGSGKFLEPQNCKEVRGATLWTEMTPETFSHKLSSELCVCRPMNFPKPPLRLPKNALEW